MARGRMISRTLGSSRKFAALHDRLSELAEFAQSLYPLLVSCSDDFGRQSGDAFTVKMAVFPSSPRCEEEFEAALVAMHNAQLIHRYEDKGQQVIQIVDFEPHQPGLSKRTKSKFSDPPGNFTEILESPGNSRLARARGREQNRTELKGTELIRSPRTDAETPEAEALDEDIHDSSVTSHTVGRFLSRFCELYTRYRHGARYMVARARDVPNVRKLLLVYAFERLEKLALILLTTDDPWVAKTDRGIGILTLKAPWLDGLLAERERKRGAS